MRPISRRSMIRGMAGAAGLAAVPDLLSTLPAEAAPAPAPAPAQQATTAAGTKGLVGATVFGTDRVAAGKAFDQLVGRPTCLKVQRVYFQDSQWPTTVDNPQPVGTLAAAGIKMLISFHPSPTPLKADRDSLKAAVALFKGIPNIDFEVALWHEANNDPGKFPNAQAYQDFVAYYAPVVQAQGIPLVYIPFITPAIENKALTFFPGPSLTDKVMVDFYGNAFVNGARIDQIMATADAAGLPFGLSEWGDSAASDGPIGPTDFGSFVGYLLELMTGRLAAGKTNADIIWFDGGGVDNDPTGPTDFRIPGIDIVFDSLTA